MNPASQKVTARHLARDAYLYIRQSTLRQVFENTESTQRQYALRRQAVALGWPDERVIVIDSDLGQSGASAADRAGFQRLVTEVGLGRAGIVLGLEVSRLARNSSDWHRLLEICALTDTLILDEDGLYDPGHFNDRLLLGLKGTMSEAELHVLRARLQGGIESKARRGELKSILPVGLVYDALDRVVLDPDQQVQQALRAFFDAYERTGSAAAVVKFFHREGLLFPRRLRRGLQKGDLIWGPLLHSRVLQVLHNPRYSGAFVYGQYRVHRNASGRAVPHRLPPDEWTVLLPDAHPGYITWEQYQHNQRRLAEAAYAHGLDRRHGPPGEGPALLQGLVVCGLCGQRMTIRYHRQGGRLVPDYVCQRAGIEHGQRICQSVPGRKLDMALGELLVELMTPLTLEVALAVHEQLQQRLEEADRLRQQQVERARYEADLAQRRFLQVDPEHRLVADALEADWNDKLRAVAEAQAEYEQQRQADQAVLDDAGREQVLALAADFPRLWRDPRTTDRERKRMVRLLIEDVTLTKAEQLTAQIRFRGGGIRTLRVPRSLSAWEARKTPEDLITEIDRLLGSRTEGQIALELNSRGRRSGDGRRFTGRIIARLRRDYGLTSRYDRLRAAGKLTAVEMAVQLGVSPATVKSWCRAGLLRGEPHSDKHEYLYDPPGDHPPVKNQGRKLSGRKCFEVLSNGTNEVQHEA